jgi:hypothetical protein
LIASFERRCPIDAGRRGALAIKTPPPKPKTLSTADDARDRPPASLSDVPGEVFADDAFPTPTTRSSRRATETDAFATRDSNLRSEQKHPAPSDHGTRRGTGSEAVTRRSGAFFAQSSRASRRN